MSPLRAILEESNAASKLVKACDLLVKLDGKTPRVDAGTSKETLRFCQTVPPCTTAARASKELANQDFIFKDQISRAHRPRARKVSFLMEICKGLYILDLLASSTASTSPEYLRSSSTVLDTTQRRFKVGQSYYAFFISLNSSLICSESGKLYLVPARSNVELLLGQG